MYLIREGEPSRCTVQALHQKLTISCPRCCTAVLADLVPYPLVDRYRQFVNFIIYFHMCGWFENDTDFLCGMSS
jgi:hypothetical protein